MSIPETPPAVDTTSVVIDDESLELAKRYNRSYYHWDDLKYRETGPFGRQRVWELMKFLRMGSSKEINVGTLRMSYNLTEDAQRRLHELDMKLSTGIAPKAEVDGKRGLMYSVSSMMEESIASSQIEGASTTTKLAKRMLRENLPPKDRSQKMICNNYQAMRFIKDRLQEDLTASLILELHAVISHGTMEDEDYEGRFRDNDTIAVRHVFEDVTYHIPPNHEEIDGLIKSLCDFANDDSEFIHPIVKAIILHFTLAYIHPFMDGNGRVSRSLFYWYMLRSGYRAAEFLSISKAIKEHRCGYDKAYLLSETDDNDITYFINYNLKMITEATDIFLKHVQKRMEENRRLLDDARASGFTLGQRGVLSDLVKATGPMDVHELASKYMVSVASMRRDLIALVEAGLATQVRNGRKILYWHKSRFELFNTFQYLINEKVSC